MQAITSGGKRYPTEYTCVARTTTRRTHNSDRADTKFLHQPVNGLMVHMGERFVYLSGIQDFFNNEIVAWYLSERNDLALVTRTLDMLSEKTDLNGILLHSDQGFQYTSKPFNHKLKKLGILGSHSNRGNCLDNACIESFFSHLKTERIYLTKPQTLPMWSRPYKNTSLSTTSTVSRRN